MAVPRRKLSTLAPEHSPLILLPLDYCAKASPIKGKPASLRYAPTGDRPVLAAGSLP